MRFISLSRGRQLPRLFRKIQRRERERCKMNAAAGIVEEIAHPFLKVLASPFRMEGEIGIGKVHGNRSYVSSSRQERSERGSDTPRAIERSLSNRYQNERVKIRSGPIIPPSPSRASNLTRDTCVFFFFSRSSSRNDTMRENCCLKTAE